jgi:Transglycosylase
VGVSSRQILKRKKRARLFFIFLLIVFAVISSCVIYVIKNKEKLIAEKVAGLAATFENKTGMCLRYDVIDTNMTSRVNVSRLRIFAKGASEQEPTVFVEDVEIGFEIVASSLVPVKLRSIQLTNPRAKLTIQPDGRPDLPGKSLEILRRIVGEKTNEDGPDTGEKKSGGRLEKFLLGILNIEATFSGGSLTVIDNHYARKSPVTMSFDDISGDLFLDILNRRMNANIDGKPETGGGRFGARLQFSKEIKSLELTGRALNLSFLAPYLPEKVRLGLHSRLDGRVNIKRHAGNPYIPVDFNADLAGFAIEDSRLAKGPIRNIRIKTEGKMVLDPTARILRLENSKIHLGSGQVNLKGSLALPKDKKPVIDLAASAKRLPVQDFLDSIPEDFIPVLKGARVDGQMDFGLDLHLNLNDAKATRIEPSVEVTDFFVVQAPPEADVRKLHGSFLHTAKKKGKVVKSFMVGPDNPDFVSFNNLGRILIGAVLTCEDGRFFRHGGFVLKHIRQSIKDDIKKSGFVRGGSTVSMQTSKNLFLSHDKTASRKFQEMLLTWWLEKEIPKKRILEIYMNIIEWGPGIYGIGPAARHYFGKNPANLSSLQSAFLGSIIKNPVRYHGYYSRGYVSHGWSSMLAFILLKMSERGTIEAEVVEWCDPYQPVFSKNGRPAPGGCQNPEELEEKDGEKAGKKKIDAQTGGEGEKSDGEIPVEGPVNEPEKPFADDEPNAIHPDDNPDNEPEVIKPVSEENNVSSI